MLNSDLHLNPGLFDTDVACVPTRDGFGAGLVKLGQTNANVVVLTGDLKESTRVEAFAAAFPERFIECGVAEQNMTGIAAGFAMTGKIPFVSSYAVFSPGRAWDQVRVNVAYNDANVKIAGAHTGLSVGPDGATHQALEDIAIMRVLPRMTVIVPCDVYETERVTAWAAGHVGPVYFRFGREKTPVITTPATPFHADKMAVYWEPASRKPEVGIIAAGPLLYEALLAAKRLEEHYHLPVRVLNAATIKPLDVQSVSRLARDCGALVTVEEHQVTGGLGSAIAEATSATYPVPIEMVGMPDSFGESGQPDELLTKYGLKAKDIIHAVQRAHAAKEGRKNAHHS